MRHSLFKLLFCAMVSLPTVAQSADPNVALEFEIAIVHLRGVELSPAQQRDLSGAAVMEAIDGWRKTGKIERMTTMRMSALEQHRASVQLGEMIPVVIGRTQAGGPRAVGGVPFPQQQQQQLQMEQLGTLVECTGRLTADGAVEVEVAAEQTRIGRIATPPVRAAEAAGEANPTPAGAAVAGPEGFHPGKVTTMAKTTAVAKSGESRIIGAAWHEGTDGVLATLVVLTPRIVGAAK